MTAASHPQWRPRQNPCGRSVSSGSTSTNAEGWRWASPSFWFWFSFLSLSCFPLGTVGFISYDSRSPRGSKVALSAVLSSDGPCFPAFGYGHCRRPVPWLRLCWRWMEETLVRLRGPTDNGTPGGTGPGRKPPAPPSLLPSRVGPERVVSIWETQGRQVVLANLSCLPDVIPDPASFFFFF